MTWIDLFLTPFYLLIIYVLAYIVKPHVSNRHTGKYFIPALSLKLLGAVCLGLVYQFYYDGGDTFSYFNSAKQIWEAFNKSTATGIDVITAEAGNYSGNSSTYTMRMWGFRSQANLMVIKIVGILGLISFGSYTVISLLFAVLSFSGLWAMYLTFYKIRPTLHKELAIASFFVPSVFFWGSGIMKDTICIGALGWAFFGFYHLLLATEKKIFSFVILAVSIFLIKEIKTYLILSFLPAAIFWIVLEYNKRIKQVYIRVLVFPLILGIGLVVAYFGAVKVSEDSDRYAIDKIAERAAITSNYLERQTLARAGVGRRTGSEYSVGTLDGSFGSILTVAPQAIVVTLYRPFLFEVRNPVMLLSAIEASWFLFLTIYIICKTGVIKFFTVAFKDPLVSFGMIFSIVFAIGVGATSGNFGTLVRYKIPLIPFYLVALYIMLAELRKFTGRKKQVRRQRYVVHTTPTPMI
ncbi:hypothetical protein [Cesiribacter sp. SM1]|uniref:hypothetical protein n=1 Tax=Cesiribacter sp. SM1 TaxID=2861196 RepID=UPI001CD6E4A7|nr:hypothetical protein [Cesiribacter sp. SM1]